MSSGSPVRGEKKVGDHCVRVLTLQANGGVFITTEPFGNKGWVHVSEQKSCFWALVKERASQENVLEVRLVRGREEVKGSRADD